MKLVIDDGGRTASGYAGLVNDCVCRAVAIATERPYREIYDRLEAMIKAKFGPTKRPRGVEALMHDELMKTLGWAWYPTREVHLRKDELPPGRLVVCINAHAVAVVDGVLHDTYDCSKWGTMPIRGFYKKDVSAHDAMNRDRKRLLNAVTKILALADRTNHEAEAATARAKAAELIAKYDIAIGSSKDLDGFKVEGEMRGWAPMPAYEFHLLDAIGTLCGVLVLRHRWDYKFVASLKTLSPFAICVRLRRPSKIAHGRTTSRPIPVAPVKWSPGNTPSLPVSMKKLINSCVPPLSNKRRCAKTLPLFHATSRPKRNMNACSENLEVADTGTAASAMPMALRQARG